ncbi:5606_t:CDS:2, partial [Gigaspora rosea]
FSNKICSDEDIFLTETTYPDEESVQQNNPEYCDYITRLDQFEFTESAMVLNTSNLDQQLAQSRTTLKRAREQFDLSKATYKRYQDLFNRKG